MPVELSELSLLDLLQLVAGYTFRWRTRGGYFRFGLAFGSAAFLLMRLLSASDQICFVAAAVVLLAWTIVWYIASGRFLLARRETIVFSVAVEVEAERNFTRIFEKLVTELRSLPLACPLAVRRVAPELARSRPDAVRYLNRFGIEQVIWGKALAGHEHRERIQKFEISHTTSLPSGVTPNYQKIAEDVGLLLQGRKWRINELDDLTDVAIVAEDFLEISLAFIGINRLIEERLSDALVMFERVVSGLQQHAGNVPSPERQAQLRRFGEIRDSIRLHLALLAEERGDHQLAAELITPLFPKHGKNISVLATAARVHYFAGDLKNAIHFTNEIDRIEKKHPIVIVNQGFFSILKRKYTRARYWYDLLIHTRKDKWPFLPSVSKFLEERLAENPDEHGYLYALAIVHGLSDTLVLKSDLEEFLRLTAARPEYEPLRVRAAEILADLS